LSGYKEAVLSNSYYMIGIFVLFIVVFYFMGIRPQQKQRKAHLEMMNSLGRGDYVMTASGIYGRVVRADDAVVVIEVAKGVTIKVVRRAVADIIRDKDRIKAIAVEGSSSSGTGRGTRASKAESLEVEGAEVVGDNDEDGQN
jgi:preprotein translocase subunit YajC